MAPTESRVAMPINGGGTAAPVPTLVYTSLDCGITRVGIV